MLANPQKVKVSDTSDDEDDVVITVVPTISNHKIDFSQPNTNFSKIDKSNQDWLEKMHKEKKILR